jgi:hypothetical protein
MIIREMHWRGLQAPHPTSWKSFLESDLRATDNFEKAIRAGREEAKKVMLKPCKFGKLQKKDEQNWLNRISRGSVQLFMNTNRSISVSIPSAAVNITAYQY